MAISGYSTDQVWAIGNDDECDKAAYDSQESLLDDIGYEGFREGYLDYYIDGEKMAEHLTEGEEDYYREDITENPSYYDLEKKMSEKDQIELEKREEELEKLSDRQTKIEENYEKYRKWYKKKSNEFFQLAKNAETEEEEEMFDKKIEELEKRFEKNEERFENLIGAITEKIDEVQEIIDELEDEDNWYYDEDEIEEKVEEYVNSKKEEIINDPMQYLKDMGYDGKAMREMIENYIDKDKLIKDMIRDDGRGNSLAGYDGTENEYLYTDEDGEQTWYYIYRIN
jgi:DNA repair exonuclease SbcCD ATPase subunit